MSTVKVEVLENYVKDTILNIVDKPDSVTVTGVLTTKAIIIQIDVDKFDRGKVIGKKGRIIDSLRTIVLAIKSSLFPNDIRRISLELIEDEESGFNFKKEGDI